MSQNVPSSAPPVRDNKYLLLQRPVLSGPLYIAIEGANGTQQVVPVLCSTSFQRANKDWSQGPETICDDVSLTHKQRDWRNLDCTYIPIDPPNLEGMNFTSPLSRS